MNEADTAPLLRAWAAHPVPPTARTGNLPSPPSALASEVHGVPPPQKPVLTPWLTEHSTLLRLCSSGSSDKQTPRQDGPGEGFP